MQGQDCTENEDMCFPNSHSPGGFGCLHTSAIHNIEVKITILVSTSGFAQDWMGEHQQFSR